MTRTVTEDQTYYQCVWYAWGHMDAGVKLAADAFSFGEYYLSLFDNPTFTPSVQSAFKTWNKGS